MAESRESSAKGNFQRVNALRPWQDTSLQSLAPLGDALSVGIQALLNLRALFSVFLMNQRRSNIPCSVYLAISNIAVHMKTRARHLLFLFHLEKYALPLLLLRFPKHHAV